MKFSVPQAAGPWTKMARLKEVRRLCTSSILGGCLTNDDGGFNHVCRGFFRVEVSLGIECFVGFRMKKTLVLFFCFFLAIFFCGGLSFSLRKVVGSALWRAI